MRDRVYYTNIEKTLDGVVLSAGIEPARPCDRGILSPLRLPIPPREQW